MKQMESNQRYTFTEKDSCTAGTNRKLLSMQEKTAVRPLVATQNMPCGKENLVKVTNHITLLRYFSI